MIDFQSLGFASEEEANGILRSFTGYDGTIAEFAEMHRIPAERIQSLFGAINGQSDQRFTAALDSSKAPTLSCVVAENSKGLEGICTRRGLPIWYSVDIYVGKGPIRATWCPNGNVYLDAKQCRYHGDFVADSKYLYFRTWGTDADDNVVWQAKDQRRSLPLDTIHDWQETWHYNGLRDAWGNISRFYGDFHC